MPQIKGKLNDPLGTNHMPGDGHNKAIAMEAQTLRQELRADALNGMEIVDRKQTWYLRQQVLAVPDWLEAAGAPQLPAPAGGVNMALALVPAPL